MLKDVGTKKSTKIETSQLSELGAILLTNIIRYVCFTKR